MIKGPQPSAQSNSGEYRPSDWRPQGAFYHATKITSRLQQSHILSGLCFGYNAHTAFTTRPATGFVLTSCCYWGTHLTRTSALEIPELLMAIFQHCSQDTLATCCRVSRYWNVLAVDVLWKEVNFRALIGLREGNDDQTNNVVRKLVHISALISI